MKQTLLFSLLLLILVDCKAQEFNLHNMKYFNEDFFIDWEVNRQYVPIGDDKYFKKGNRKES